jgi:DNA-binding NarL/FixJ family response regulator
MSRVRTLLADDHEEFIHVIEGLLEPTFEVVEKVGDGEALLEAAEKLRPDVILTDISMPFLDGIQAVRKLRESNLPAKIIFLTMHSDSEIVRACMYAGATGYVLKSRINADLMPALHEVLAGGTFVSVLNEESVERSGSEVISARQRL